MEAVLKSDIFFFITSISVVIFTIIVVIVSFYLIKILKNFSDASDVLKNILKDGNTKLLEVKKKISNNPFFSLIFKKNKKEQKHKTKSRE